MVMGLFANKKIDDITDIDELFVALMKRKHWSRIPKGILRQIFDNANGDIEKVQRFRFVSEIHHCVDNNFIPLLEDNSNPSIALALFSVTLERLAAQAAQSVPALPDGSREQDMAIGTAESAYISSILCNPLMLPSYVGLACCYMVLGSSDRAAQVCRDYDAAEQKLLSSDDNDLSYYDQAMKSDISEIRKMVDQVKAEVGIQ
jgi:hypothetical protein